MPKDFIKLWVNPWLDGSTRSELSPAERSVWIDLLALAGRYNKEGIMEGIVPIDRPNLCRILQVTRTLLDHALEKCIRYEKIEILPNGHILIKNWEIYNPSRQLISKIKAMSTHVNACQLCQRGRHELTQLTQEGEGEGDRDREGERSSSNIFTLYEENIGLLTPLVGDDLKEAEEIYPFPWIEAAFREAARLNKRSWKYVETILRRWQDQGYADFERKSAGTTAPREEWL
jgi:DnaD/phage-associated family protein